MEDFRFRLMVFCTNFSKLGYFCKAPSSFWKQLYLLSRRPTHTASLGALASVDCDDLESMVVEGAWLGTVSVLDSVRGAYPGSVMGDGCCRLLVYSHGGH